MAIHLSTPVSELPGIGSAAVKDLKNLGIVSVRDLLLYFPFRYEDFSKTKPIANLQNNDTATVRGRISNIESRKAKNRRMTLTEAIVEDESGGIKVIWFNQPYLEKTLRTGTPVSLAGTVDSRFGKTLVNPIYEPITSDTHTGRIVPVYGLSGSLTMRRLRNAIKSALSAANEFIEWLPKEIRAAESFDDLASSINAIHFPESRDKLDQAIARLKFDELFLHQMLFEEVRAQRKIKSAHSIPINKDFLKQFVVQLPFTLTNDQKRAAWEIIQDTEKEKPMNRLLQGDVGSGKTVVAAMAIAHAIQNKQRCVYLAPTEILAKQQYDSLKEMIPGIGIMTRLIKDYDNDFSCLVGTHALLQESVDLPKLGLIVIDEQHRFGVQQRHALLETGDKAAPHLLSMTATPIPRSLALTLYGDLDISIIREKPKGRKPILTKIAFSKEKQTMYKHVLNEIKAKRRVYIVCPLIDPSDKLGAKSVTQVVSELKKGILKKTNIQMLHGKLKADEKRKILEEFREGQIDVLVSTTVVEVGVDIPDATVMVIQGAERFGLAQLHQLRGRVGRSDLQSTCYLVPDSWTPQTKERLMAMVRSNDGFYLAEVDLKMRGAGNIFGNSQSGFPDFKLATPADVELMVKARDWPAKIRTKDPTLESHPLLKQYVVQSLDQVHLE